MDEICVPGLRPSHFPPEHPLLSGWLVKKRGGLRQSRPPWRRLEIMDEICVPGLRTSHFPPRAPTFVRLACEKVKWPAKKRHGWLCFCGVVAGLVGENVLVLAQLHHFMTLNTPEI